MIIGRIEAAFIGLYSGLLLTLAIPTPTYAQSSDPRPTQDPEALPDGQRPKVPLKLVGSISEVSDYRFRGVSLSDNDPALQGGGWSCRRKLAFTSAHGAPLFQTITAHVQKSMPTLATATTQLGGH